MPFNAADYGDDDLPEIGEQLAKLYSQIVQTPAGIGKAVTAPLTSLVITSPLADHFAGGLRQLIEQLALGTGPEDILARQDATMAKVLHGVQPSVTTDQLWATLKTIKPKSQEDIEQAQKAVAQVRADPEVWAEINEATRNLTPELMSKLSKPAVTVTVFIWLHPYLSSSSPDTRLAALAVLVAVLQVILSIGSKSS